MIERVLYVKRITATCDADPEEGGKVVRKMELVDNFSGWKNEWSLELPHVDGFGTGDRVKVFVDMLEPAGVWTERVEREQAEKDAREKAEPLLEAGIDDDDGHGTFVVEIGESDEDTLDDISEDDLDDDDGS